MKAEAPARITLLAQDPDLGLSQEAFFTRSGATQKGRILEAATHVIAEMGYAGATVGQIVSAAGVSRTTFYEHFAGKKECLLASYEVATQIVLTTIATAVVETLPRGWRAAFEAGLDAYLDAIRSEPEIVRAQFVEFGSIGADAVIARKHAREAHTQAILSGAARARAQGGEAPELDAGVIRLLLAGIEERIAQSAAEGDASDVDELRASILSVVDRLLG